MIVRFVLVAYCAGVLLGVLGLIEWLVARIARACLSSGSVKVRRHGRTKA